MKLSRAKSLLAYVTIVSHFHSSPLRLCQKFSKTDPEPLEESALIENFETSYPEYDVENFNLV